ncbi:MAG: sulfite exporter TauE/SafE family protein, partial [Sedimentisphaerales bacterium]|nr:sulfite exporter TauE/SafE family protein [Sedimentisphaerales bacterium]
SKPWLKIILLGLLGGFATMAANAASPLFTLYILYLGLSKNQFIGTWAWLFLIINLSKVPLHWDLGNITTESLHYNILMLPAIIIGFIAGYYLVKKIPQEKFELIIRVLAALGALKMVIG